MGGICNGLGEMDVNEAMGKHVRDKV